MTLQENLPSDKRQPGTYVSFDDVSGSRGLPAVTRKLMVVAMKLASAPATVDKPIVVSDEREARFLFGEGSEAALMVEWANRTWAKVTAARGGAAAQIHVTPVADPAGTAAIHQFVATGSAATESGTAALFVAGRRVNVPISSGDSDSTIATAIAAAVQKIKRFLPATAAVNGGTDSIVDVTANNTGTNGGRILLAVDQQTLPAGVTITVTQDSTAGLGTADLTDALASTLAKSVAGSEYMSLAIANHVAQDLTDLGTHMDSAWDSKRQAFRHAIVGVNESLGTATTLAAGSNRKQTAVACMPNCGNTPGEIAASVAAVNLYQDNPAYNHNRTKLPLFASIDPDDHLEDSEVETALDGGVTPISVDEQGEALLERLFTTKATESGVAFENLRPLKNSKTGAFIAKGVDGRLKITQLGQNLDSDYLRLIKREAIQILREAEGRGWIHRVTEHLAEVRAAVSQAIADRSLLEVPYSVLPSANQTDGTYRMFVEGAEL
jgi:phage tail sheath gpL-like